MQVDIPMTYAFKHYPDLALVIVETHGFTKATQQAQMVKDMFEYVTPLPKPLRLVVDYNDTIVNVIELTGFLATLPNIMPTFKAQQLLGPYIIDGSTSWGQLAANLTRHPRFGGVSIRVFCSQQEVFDFMKAKPLTGM
ncbi:MAG: hypothetical protein ACOYL5_04580 [Phototrophicaceae bacterium]